MIVLPKVKTERKVNNPNFAIFYGRPKAGKSSLMASMDSNLIIDLENGYKALSALVVQARSVKDFGEIATAIREEIKNTGNKPYKYITIDNATRLEEMCLSYAAQLYIKMEHYVEIHNENSLNFWKLLPNAIVMLYI